MHTVSPPEYVENILAVLRTNGYPAYPVGGCVRDALLGISPNDWDVCTRAVPEEVMRLFPKSRPTGLRHGTVTVNGVEVTTFRSEGQYLDHRRPSSVTFVDDLCADLSRRDFTMNAIALAPDGSLCDPFGGAADIEKGLIRCVGDPDVRFEEDALRMLRAVRFAAKLGFAIEESTLAAVYRKAPLAAELAPERVREELDRILQSDRPELISLALDAGLLDRCVLRRVCPVSELARVPKGLARWALFCHLLRRAGCISSAGELLSALRADRHTLRCCAEVGAILSAPLPASDYAWKLLLEHCGEEGVLCAAECADVLFASDSVRRLRRILESGECFTMKELAVNGSDLLSLGVSGRELGAVLRRLLEHVMEKPEDNEREILMRLASGGNTLG